MNQELSLRIILEKTPAGIDFGLQQGSGSHYGTIQTQRSGNHDLVFDFPVTVKHDKDGQPDFAGVFVQGPRAKRFIYIDIGQCAGQHDTHWSRRLKIPLTGITPSMIKELSANSTQILQAKVPGTGKDKGPNCATVKPFSGWHVSNR